MRVRVQMLGLAKRFVRRAGWRVHTCVRKRGPPRRGLAAPTVLSSNMTPARLLLGPTSLPPSSYDEQQDNGTISQISTSVALER